MQKLLKQVIVLAITLVTGMGVMVAIFGSTNVSAADYNFSVTIPEGEILEVKLFNSDGTAMGSSTSMNVAPSSLSSAGFNEKNVVVSVATSNEFGYNLVMNVANTNLTSSENNTIPNLASKTGGYTCSAETAATCDFTVNSWGFKIKNNTATQEATNYIPVPSTINLNKNSSVTNGDPTYLSFGSRVNAAQAPGSYQTTINFTATANPDPDPRPVMQNISASTLAGLMPSNGSTTILKDSRDGNKYQITNINGTYWMTSNLKIMGTISASDSNFTGADFNISAGGDLTAGDTYTEPRAHYNTSDTNSSTYGAYYNYCAASAGTVCSQTKRDATSDICPKGWRLPTQTEITTIKNNNVTNFNPVLAGYYYGGSLVNAGSLGYWWSATAYNSYGQYYFYYNGSSWNVYSGNKYYGLSVRCIYGPLPPTMQNVDSAKLAQLMPTDGSTTTLPDSRDGNVYNIARIGNTYWMTDNLKIMGTISAADSNFTGADFNISAGGDLTAGSTYTEPRAHYNTSDTNSSTYGAYYNYCAASAGTVCSQTKRDATSDICPKGWRLPTQTEAQAFANASSSNKNPVLAGYYYGGSLRNASSYGYWWSAAAYDTRNQYGLYYNGSSWYVNNSHKGSGFSVRCVRSL